MFWLLLCSEKKHSKRKAENRDRTYDQIYEVETMYYVLKALLFARMDKRIHIFV